MLAKPSPQQLAALRRLARGDSDFKTVLEWLEHSQRELDKANRVVEDGILMRRQQGACLAVEDFLATAKGSNAALTVAK